MMSGTGWSWKSKDPEAGSVFERTTRKIESSYEYKATKTSVSTKQSLAYDMPSDHISSNSYSCSGQHHLVVIQRGKK